MNPADWTPSGILVSGVIASDARAIGDALQALGSRNSPTPKHLKILVEECLPTRGEHGSHPLRSLPQSSPFSARHVPMKLPITEHCQRSMKCQRTSSGCGLIRAAVFTPFWSTALRLDLRWFMSIETRGSFVAAISVE